MSTSAVHKKNIIAVVPAAGVGSRMQADRPKQYLTVAGKTILEHSVDGLLSHPDVAQVIIAISPQDPYFYTLSLHADPRVTVVDGGAERADSVLSGLAVIADEAAWALVHDAARPCLRHSDLDKLLAIAHTESAHAAASGAILAAPVRDTMKRGNGHQGIAQTVDRSDLWHALTPQLFPVAVLRDALQQALCSGQPITDEASAIELMGGTPQMVVGRSDNLKVTQPEDLALAEFYLQQRIKEQG